MAVPERTVWSDERLNDEIGEIRTDLRALAPVATQVAVLEAEFADMQGDLRDIERLSRRMHKRIRKALLELDTVRTEQRIEERHANRAHRWWMRWSGVIQAVGSTIAAMAGIAGLVIAILTAAGGHV